MKSIYILVIIALFNLQCSCSSKLPNEYKIGEHKLQINISKTFTELSTDETNNYYENGINHYKQKGYTGFSDQKSIFFFRKGEFSLIKAKSYDLIQDPFLNYKNQWTDLKGTLFKILEEKTLEMDGATIDSSSSIKQINGIDFYILETNIYLLDLNNVKTNLKSLRYSTPIDNQDFVIDVSFINQDDGIELIKSLNSIKITD